MKRHGRMSLKTVPLIVALACAALVPPSLAADPRQQIIAGYEATAKAAKPGFNGFSSERGEAFFRAAPGTGKPETPSCTTCHTADPRAAGKTRAGKAIAPMAVSIQADRYLDAAKVEKWYRRNCRSVLGRECTAIEKGDFLTFMINR